MLSNLLFVENRLRGGKPLRLDGMLRARRRARKTRRAQNLGHYTEPIGRAGAAVRILCRRLTGFAEALTFLVRFLMNPIRSTYERTVGTQCTTMKNGPRITRELRPKTWTR